MSVQSDRKEKRREREHKVVISKQMFRIAFMVTY